MKDNNQPPPVAARRCSDTRPLNERYDLSNFALAEDEGAAERVWTASNLAGPPSSADLVSLLPHRPAR
jgi:hypothetical protein